MIAVVKMRSHARRGVFPARRLLVVLLIAAQIGFIAYALSSGSRLSRGIGAALELLSLMAALHVVVSREGASYKLMWVFLIMLFPILGGAFYVLVLLQPATRRLSERFDRVGERTLPLLLLPEGVADDGRGALPEHAQSRYLRERAGFPAYRNTETAYLSPGESMLEALMLELEKAERYIFLEFFTICEGSMWGGILEVLARKAGEGVKVRVIYDDAGCFVTLPSGYPARLERMGIECRVFNPLTPALITAQNNRDHRKIVSIDGVVAFTGGINLADEYVNEYEKHGHWKDSAVMVRGDAAWSLTVVFLQMWGFCSGVEEDVAGFLPLPGAFSAVRDDGLVQPYADSPLDSELVGRDLYLLMISQARSYVYVTTPYLILDEPLASAFALAAKRGVDVRVITPGIWDKRLVHMATRSYYPELFEAGVGVYEYSGGFMHSKCVVCDDRVATVGTVNMDYRSLRLHFECGVWMCGSEAVGQVKGDIDETLARCVRVEASDCRRGVAGRLLGSILRLLAPLM